MKNILTKYQEKRKAKAEAHQAKKADQTRKPEAISAEYNRVCAEVGDKQYRVAVFQKEIEQLNERLKTLNQEFYLSKQVHKEEPKAVEAAPVAAPAEASHEAQAV